MHGQSSGVFIQKAGVADLTRFEFALIAPLIISIFWLGLKPMA
jgi:hypothetical protein